MNALDYLERRGLMTQLLEIGASFVVGVIVARLYWNTLISRAKSLTAGLEKKL